MKSITISVQLQNQTHLCMSHRSTVLVGPEAHFTALQTIGLYYLMAAKLEIYNKVKFSSSHKFSGSIKQ